MLFGRIKANLTVHRRSPKGNPGLIIYSLAVKKVLPNGERELTDEFQRFVYIMDLNMNSAIRQVGMKKAT